MKKTLTLSKKPKKTLTLTAKNRNTMKVPRDFRSIA